MTELPQVPEPRVRCMHMQSKALAIHGEAFESAADYHEDSANCWCNLTARPIGPDGNPVNLKACSQPDRECHQEY